MVGAQYTPINLAKFGVKVYIFWNGDPFLIFDNLCGPMHRPPESGSWMSCTSGKRISRGHVGHGRGGAPHVHVSARPHLNSQAAKVKKRASWLGLSRRRRRLPNLLDSIFPSQEAERRRRKRSYRLSRWRPHHDTAIETEVGDRRWGSWSPRRPCRRRRRSRVRRRWLPWRWRWRCGVGGRRWTGRRRGRTAPSSPSPPPTRSSPPSRW